MMMLIITMFSKSSILITLILNNGPVIGVEKTINFLLNYIFFSFFFSPECEKDQFSITQV
jgi:hypothetical protein